MTDTTIETPKATNPAKPRCIVCGQEGQTALCSRVPIQPKGKIRKVRLTDSRGGSLLVDSGDLAAANMVGAGHPPSDFPGDPTGKKYYGSGAGAYVLFHPECCGKSVEAYNALLRTLSAQMADDEEWVYDHEKPASEGPWRGSNGPAELPPRAIPVPGA